MLDNDVVALLDTVVLKLLVGEVDIEVVADVENVVVTVLDNEVVAELDNVVLSLDVGVLVAVLVAVVDKPPPGSGEVGSAVEGSGVVFGTGVDVVVVFVDAVEGSGDVVGCGEVGSAVEGSGVVFGTGVDVVVVLVDAVEGS